MTVALHYVSDLLLYIKPHYHDEKACETYSHGKRRLYKHIGLDLNEIVAQATFFFLPNLTESDPTLQTYCFIISEPY